MMNTKIGELAWKNLVKIFQIAMFFFNNLDMEICLTLDILFPLIHHSVKKELVKKEKKNVWNQALPNKIHTKIKS